MPEIERLGVFTVVPDVPEPGALVSKLTVPCPTEKSSQNIWKSVAELDAVAVIVY